MSDSLYDSGAVGQLVSMSGLKGRDGAGVKVWSSTPAPTTTPVVVVSTNPARLWVSITNEGTVDIQISLDGTFNNGYSTIVPKGSVLFDKNAPWTGAIWAKTGAGTGLIGLFEAMVQP